MARPNIKKIRASTHPLGTGDFTTIQAWEDFADDKINPYQWAECYAGFNLGTFTLSGWSATPTSSGYPRVFASSGEAMAGASFNHGPVIATPSGTTDVNTIAVNYSQVDGLGSTRGFHINLETASNVIIENCWATSESNTCFKAKTVTNSTASSGNIIRNCLAIGTNTHDIGFEVGGEEMMGGMPEVQVLNCTAFGHKNSGFKIFNSKAPGFYGGSNITIINCLGMDATGSDFAFSLGGNGSLTSQNNMSSDASAAQYGSSNLYSFSPSDVFENPDKALFTYSPSSGVVRVVASGNFRLKENSPAVNAGQTLSSVIRDIRGVRRPYYSNTDIGAYEFGFFNKRFSLFISGPVPVSSGIKLHMHAEKEQPASGYVSFYAQSLGFTRIQSSGNSPQGSGQPTLFAQSLGPTTASSGIKLYAQSLGPTTPSSGIRMFAQSQGFITVSSGVRLFAKSEGFVKIQSSGNSPVGSGQPSLFAQSLGPSTASSGIRMFAKSEGLIKASGQPTLYLPASGFATPTSGVRLFAQADGNVDSSGYVSLALLGFYQKAKAAFSAAGHGVTSSGVKLWIGAAVTSSGIFTLNIGNFTFRRKGLLFLKGPERDFDKNPLGLPSYTSTISSGVSIFGTPELSLEGRMNTSSIKASVGPNESSEMFKQDPDLETLKDEEGVKSGPGAHPLNVKGFDGIDSLTSLAYLRNRDVESSDFFPTSRKHLMFASSERDCLDGSLYKFESNTNDNSDDYNFTLYASGWGLSGSQDGLYRTTTRFPLNGPLGTGVARFAGGHGAAANGQILMQSGSPSIHDQHRITARSGEFVRRGVSVSFWINRKKAVNVDPGLKTLQGVMGNLEFNQTRFAASGQWGIYYVPSITRPSGTTPFNSIKSLLTKDAEGKLKVDTKSMGGLLPFVSTTAGGRMGRILKTNLEGELVLEHVPDTMIPLDEDRWYYIQYWIDAQESISYVRVASPAKGKPGLSGYRPEIKPITDKSQNWSGYEIKTDIDNLKFKVGGELMRQPSSLPYFNLGYSFSESQQEEFHMDELTLSNKVCSPLAMEQKFDEDYYNYIKYFIEQKTPPLFITGESGVL
tara:strand:+ start:307 stop:3537 length:3231 start_codon:yes stop_codon:yes gene_type:complete